MRLRRTFFLLLLGLPALAACKRGGTLPLTDSENRSFEMRCEGPKCALHRVKAPPVSEDRAAVVLKSKGRIVGICDTAPDDKDPPAFDCRPIKCSANEQCPNASGLEAGVCVNGHCIEPSQDVNTDDSIMLCLAGTGTGRSQPKQVERFALALNCGQPCKVPALCQQP